MATTKVNIEKTFPYAADGIGIKIEMLQAGSQAEISHDVLEGLLNEGYVSHIEGEIDDAPPIVPDILTKEEDVAEYSKEYFLLKGKDAMVDFLTENGEEDLTGNETEEELAILCEMVFAEDDD